MEERKQFTFYHSYLTSAENLPSDRRDALLYAIAVYGLRGTLPEKLDYAQKGIFDAVKPNLDASWRKAMCGRSGGSVTKARGNKQGGISKGEIEKEKKKENEIENEYETEGEEARQRANFNAFWAIYPIKIGLENALEQWISDPPDLNKVISGVRAWRACPQWRQESGRFIPLPVKFLKDKYYEQIPPATTSGVKLSDAEVQAIQELMEG